MPTHPNLASLDSSRPSNDSAAETRRRVVWPVARGVVPRSSQGAYAPAAQRRDPIRVLDEEALTNVAEPVSIRYGRMLYRGRTRVNSSRDSG
ncbi:MAG: hypothetical protein QOI02_1126 [Actinomycetota bacterium]|nr:hypothetical protein [Actinomycetota bacterium]